MTDMLSRLSESDLAAGIVKGEGLLRTLDALEASEDFGGDGPFRTSKTYEQWSASDFANRRRQIEFAMNETRREQARRAQPQEPV